MRSGAKKDTRPKSVRILGRTITLTYVKDFALFGEFDQWKGNITVRDGLTPTEERDTVLHETLHAIWWLMDIGKPRSSEVEEFVVRKLSNGLTQVFQDNPLFHAYLGKV